MLSWVLWGTQREGQPCLGLRPLEEVRCGLAGPEGQSARWDRPVGGAQHLLGALLGARGGGSTRSQAESPAWRLEPGSGSPKACGYGLGAEASLCT